MALVLRADRNGTVSYENITGVLTSPAHPEQRFAFEYRSADGNLRIEQVNGVKYGEVAQAVNSIARERLAVRDAFATQMKGQLGDDFSRIVEVDCAGEFALSRKRQDAACDAFRNIVGIPRSYDISFNTYFQRRIDITRPIVGNIFTASGANSIYLGAFEFNPTTGEISFERRPVSRAGFGVALELSLAEKRGVFSVEHVLAREQEKGHAVVLNGTVGGKQVIVAEGGPVSIRMSDVLHVFYGPPNELRPVRVTFAHRTPDGGTTRLTGVLPDGTELDVRFGIRLKGEVNGTTIDESITHDFFPAATVTWPGR
jgi:hypothetical protein